MHGVTQALRQEVELMQANYESSEAGMHVQRALELAQAQCEERTREVQRLTHEVRTLDEAR